MSDLKPGDPGYIGPLKGKDAICKFLDIGDAQFEEIVKMGAPIRLLGRRFYSHSRILEEWLCIYCTRTAPIPAGTPMEEEK